MILGKAPSWDDDRYGRPFVGAEGKLLTEALEEAGLEDYYTTHTAKCVPGLKVGKEHIKACAPYLEEEIAEIRPTHILALGNEAVQRLLGKGKVSEIAGKEIWSENYNCWVMATWHPVYILRQMGRIGAWKKDLYRFVRLCKNELAEKPPVNVHLVGADLSFGDFRKMLIERTKRLEPFAFDFETSYFERVHKVTLGDQEFKVKTKNRWWDQDWRAYTVAFAWSKDEAFCLPLDHTESLMGDRSRSLLREIEPYVSGPTTNAIGHNGVLFDSNVWWRVAGYPIFVKYDTMLEAQLNDENRPKRLKWLGGAILGWPDWDIDAKIEHPLGMLAEYNGYDAAATIALHDIQFAQMEDDVKRYYLALEMPKARSVAAIERRGVFVDRKSLDAAIEVTESLMVEARERIPVDNPASPKQVGEWLYDKEGLPVPHESAGGGRSTDRESINELAIHFPQARLIRDFRTHAKRLGTWLLPVREEIALSADGRKHFDYGMLVETGRLSSPYHTTPRDKLVRNIYHAPLGWELVSADESQLEARLVAWASCGFPNDWESPQVMGMLRVFLDWERDIYKEFAAEALRKPLADITKDERQNMGKVPILAMIYKISPEGLQEYAWKVYELRFTIAEARHLWQLFHDMYPEIHRWHEREEKFLKVRGYARSLLGRYRHLPEAVGGGRGAAVQEAIRAGINSPIQGLGSDINETAHILLDRKLDPRRAFVIGSHHDSLQVQTMKSYMSEALMLVHWCYDNAPQALRGLGLDLPPGLLKIEVSVGPWGS